LPTLSSEAEPTTAPELLAVLRGAEREMRALKDSYISVEHLLLALANDDGSGDGGQRRDPRAHPAGARRGADGPGHRRVAGGEDPRARALRPRPTEAAEDGKLDPVIGRDDEIRRVIQVLSRRTKNNP